MEKNTETITIVMTTTTGLKATVMYDLVAGIDDQKIVTNDDLKGGDLSIIFERASMDIIDMLNNQ